MFVIDVQAITHGVFAIVITLDQRFAGFVVHIGHARRIKHDVIATAGRRMHTTS